MRLQTTSCRRYFRESENDLVLCAAVKLPVGDDARDIQPGSVLGKEVDLALIPERSRLTAIMIDLRNKREIE